MKSILIIFFFLLLNNCSLNKDSKYWTEESVNFDKEKNKKINDKKKLTNILKKSTNITTMTLEEYEIYIDDYTKKSKYPDISQ